MPFSDHFDSHSTQFSEHFHPHSTRSWNQFGCILHNVSELNLFYFPSQMLFSVHFHSHSTQFSGHCHPHSTRSWKQFSCILHSVSELNLLYFQTALRDRSSLHSLILFATLRIRPEVWTQFRFLRWVHAAGRNLRFDWSSLRSLPPRPPHKCCFLGTSTRIQPVLS